MRKHVLVVDDNPTLRGLLQNYLESRGCAVETAENGREALTRLNHAGYDMVLLDYMMPGVNGLEVLRHVRQHHPSLPVVMMTAEKSSQVAYEALSVLGARACLSKPFDLLDLEQVLNLAPPSVPTGPPGP